VHFRDKTGEGQKLDISLMDVQISLASYLTSYYLVGGILSGPQGSRHGTVVPYEAFQTKDTWIVVACVTEPMWEGLCISLGLEELIIDERFNNSLKRLENHDILIEILQERFLTKTTDEWIARLDESSVPCAGVNTIDRALSHPQTLARDMVIQIDHPRFGSFKLAGNPIKASKVKDVFVPPPQLGEYTAEVLKGVLGYSDDKINELKQEKLIGVLEEETNE